jgi:hypothetical protein
MGSGLGTQVHALERNMASTKLSFVVKLPGGSAHLREVFVRFPTNVLNRTAWRGKEPRSCAITHVASGLAATIEPTIVDVEVSYRPKGCISYSGNTRYDGWTAMPLDRRNDGVLLNGNGEPLEDGKPPVYLPKEVYTDVEFNDIDFGQFVGETEVTVKTTTLNSVMEELKASGGFNTSIHGSFMAPRRTRPLTKIILSNAPTGEAYDRFGTHIININQSTTHLEFVLMEQLTKLIFDFIEGRASVKHIGNDQVAFVQLSSSLIDCSPNENGLETWFDMLQSYTPVGFLEDLAKRLMSVYAIDVAVIEGKQGGLVLRHEPKK